MSNPFRRTDGEQREYRVPEEVSKRELRCPDCYSVDWLKGDIYAQNKPPIVAFCEECGTMYYFKIVQWAAYKRRYENEQ